MKNASISFFKLTFGKGIKKRREKRKQYLIHWFYSFRNSFVYLLYFQLTSFPGDNFVEIGCYFKRKKSAYYHYF